MGKFKLCFENSAMRVRSAVFYLNERSIILKSSPRFLEFVREETVERLFLVFEIVLNAMSADLPVVTLTAADIPGAHLCEPYDKHSWVVTSFKSSVITCPFMANVTQSEP